MEVLTIMGNFLTAYKFTHVSYFHNWLSIHFYCLVSMILEFILGGSSLLKMSQTYLYACAAVQVGVKDEQENQHV